MSDAIGRLDNTIHQRVRLGIMTVLNEVERADFAYLRSALELTDGNLSSNLSTLEEAGFVTITKAFEGKRPRTWVAATAAGERALADEIRTLRRIVASVDGDGSIAPAGADAPTAGQRRG